MSSRILIIEDETSIAELEKDYLELSGFEVELEEQGDVGLERALNEDFDLLILDLMLPGMDGFEICKRFREVKNTPIIMISAKKDDIDKIRGLGYGADDYIAKPFSPGVLVAKVKAQLAQYDRLKGTKKETKRITLGDIMLEPDTRRVWVDGKEKELPNKEFQLLEFLMEHPDVVFSRESLYTRIWGLDSLGNTSTVPVHINRLRETVEKDPANPRHIITIWGVGYKFKP